MPAIFVAIWSTGFVVARLAMPHVPPFTFLSWRYALSVLAFIAWATLARVAWPVGRGQWMHLAITGLMMHGGYLGGVWAAVRAGAPAGHGGAGRRPAAGAHRALGNAARHASRRPRPVDRLVVGPGRSGAGGLAQAGPGRGDAVQPRPFAARAGVDHRRHALPEAACQACGCAIGQCHPVGRCRPGLAAAGLVRAAADGVAPGGAVGAGLVGARPVAGRQFAADAADPARARPPAWPA